MGCSFNIRIVLDLAGNTLELLIEMCLGSCCFDIWVCVHRRGAVPQEGHCWGTSLACRCRHLQEVFIQHTCSSEGLQP